MAGDGAAWLGKGYTREARWPALNLDIDLRYSGKSLRPFARKPLARLSNTADRGKMIWVWATERAWWPEGQVRSCLPM